LKPREDRIDRCKKEIRPGLWLDSGLALFFELENTLVISDIHWGYAEVHRNQGNLFPLWGDLEIARRIDALLKIYQPGRMIWLGDSLHGAKGQRAAEHYLAALDLRLEVVLIGGNHDRRWKKELRDSFRLGDYLLHHGDQFKDVPTGVCEVVGHWHPALTHRDGAGLSLKLPVLVEQPRRLILPAFSPWSKGTDWEAGAGDELWIVAPKRIWKIKAQVLPL